MRSMRRLLRNLLYLPRYSHYCNICGYRVDFKGPLSPEGLICPGCDASSRDRMLIFCFQQTLVKGGIYKSICEALPLLYNPRFSRTDKTVVETSPRLKGNYKLFMKRRFCYLDTDYDENAYKAESKEDLQNLTFECESVDLMLCSHVLEHVPDPKKAMREMYRVIKPGGAVFIQVPIYYFETEKVDGEEFHGHHTKVYWYIGWNLAHHLENEGFTVSIAVTEDLYDFIYRGKNISLFSEPWDMSHNYQEMDRVRTLPFEVFCDSRQARLYGILPPCNQHVFIATK